jgi:ABC-2 type transport system ATP-binding protein
MMETDSNLVVNVKALRKNYGEVQALRDMNLEVWAGERYGLIGPDGAGKTTLLRILTGLLVPQSGEVRVLGFDPVTQQEKIKSGIGYMPQRFSLYPDLTVAENMRFFADIYHIPKEERQRLTERLLHFSRLGPFVDRRAGALSGGMKQKLALSCTLIHTPKLLILDEPTTGVDPVSREEFWAILNDLRGQGVTVLVTTPYMDEAALCDRVTLVYQGQVLATGTPDEVTASFPRRIVQVFTPQPQEAARALEGVCGSDPAQLFGDRVHLAVNDVEACIQEAKRKLEAVGLPYSSIQEGRPSLEDTFVYLITDSQKLIANSP